MKKKIFLSLLTLASVFTMAGVGSLTSNVAKADGDAATITTAAKTDFYLKSGAAIYVKDTTVSGLRFSANVNEAYITQLTEAGEIQYCMLLAPKSKVSNLADLTLETAKEMSAKAIYSTKTPNFTDEANENETFTYYGAISYDMTDWAAEKIEKAYTTELVARPYIVVTQTVEDVTTKEVIYADISEGTARDMRTVANNAIIALSQKAENAPKLTTDQFTSLLSYTVNKDVKAFHEQGGTVIVGTANKKGAVEEKQLSVDTNSLTLVDGAAYAGQTLYAQGTEAVDGKEYVTLDAYGTVAVGSVAKNGIVTKAGETDLPTTALSASSKSVVLMGADSVVTTSFTEVTQIIDNFTELQTAFDYSIYIPTWLEQGTKTGHYVVANDINNVGTNVYAAINYANAASLRTNGNISANWKTIGFNGVFDGLGHSLTFRTGGGLFNGLLEGVQIRNVALKDILIHADNEQHFSPLGSGAAVAGCDKKGSISNVYISLSANSYNKKVSILPNQAGWIEMENIVVDLDYSNAPTLADGETAVAGIYLSYHEHHQRGWNTAQYANYAKINNIQVFVRNYNAETVKYTFKWINNTNTTADYTTYPKEKYPYGHPFCNILTEIGKYESYAGFVSGIEALDRNGEAFTITAGESFAKFAKSEYWKVVTVGEGDTAYSYPTWYK